MAGFRCFHHQWQMMIAGHVTYSVSSGLEVTAKLKVNDGEELEIEDGWALNVTIK